MADRITATELRFERDLAAPVETVWQYLIDPELRARWLMGGPTEAREGGKLGLTMRHDLLVDEPEETPETYAKNHGKSWSETITRIEPPHLLAFTWSNGEDGDITIELAGAGEGRTRLVLTHRGIRIPDHARMFGGGWSAHLAVLQKRLAGEPVSSFWKLFHAEEAKAKAALAG